MGTGCQFWRWNFDFCHYSRIFHGWSGFRNRFHSCWLGVLLFGCTTVFTLVTLPVEFDASKRALVCLKQGNYATEKELDGARKVLNAAAMTYVAAFITSLLTLLYWAHKLGLLGGRR